MPAVEEYVKRFTGKPPIVSESSDSDVLTMDEFRESLFNPVLELCKDSLCDLGIHDTVDEKKLSLRNAQWNVEKVDKFITDYGSHNKSLTSMLSFIRHIPDDLCTRAQGSNSSNWNRRWSEQLGWSFAKNDLLDELLANEAVSSLCGSIIADVELLDGLKGKVFHNIREEEQEFLPFSQKNTQEREEAEERQEETLFVRELEAAAADVSKSIDSLVKNAIRKGISFPTSMEMDSGKKPTPGFSPMAAATVDALEKVSYIYATLYIC